MISIIIVNWNGRKWIEKCLGSLHAQTYRNFEIIFVDNASTDDSVEFVQKNYPEVIVVQSDENLGFAGGNNLGIRQAKGDLLLLLNNDTWVENDFLGVMVSLYEETGCDVIAPEEFRYDGKPPVERGQVMRIDPFGHPVGMFGSGMPPFYVSGVCLLFSRDLYLDTGGLDSDFFMYFEENDWFWRLHLLKKTFRQCDDVRVYHSGGGSTGYGLSNRLFLWRNQNTLQMLLKNYSWYNLLWVLPIYCLQNLVEVFVFFSFLKPKIAWSYVEGWLFNLRYLKRTLRKRRWVQENRLVGDREIMKKMYLGFGKFVHLSRFLRS